MINKHAFHFLDDEEAPEEHKPCAFEGCNSFAEYPAPKSPEEFSTRIWLCLEHVRIHNANWNYYAGMNVGEIESHWRSCATWERPTWPLGGQFGFRKLHDSLQRQFEDWAGKTSNQGETSRNQQNTCAFPPQSPEAKAMQTLEIAGDVSLESLKMAYKKKVKQYHPDRNHGCKQSEEKLKEINVAYAVLMAEVR